MVVLGILFNTIDMTISIAPDRVHEIQHDIDTWHDKTLISCKQLESLISKLQFASQVVSAGQVLARLLDELWGSPKKGYFPVPDHIFQDLMWWDTIMPILNGTMSIYLDIFFEPGVLIDTDTMLVGAGGVCKGHYFHARFPQVITREAHIIAHLELLAFILALKAWPHLVANTKFIAHLDNMVAVAAINSGCSWDPYINAELREIAYLSAVHNFKVRVHHIPGVNNTIQDLLSCWDLGDSTKGQFRDLTCTQNLPEPSSKMNGLSFPTTGNLLISMHPLVFCIV